MDSTLLALVLGALQGVLEWLPVSSEGVLAIALTGLGTGSLDAASLALVLHGGTAVAALAYYRREVAGLLRTLPTWRPGTAFGAGTADLSFYVLATLASGLTGAAGFLVLEEVATAVAGGAFVILVGVLLVATGALLWRAERADGPGGAGGATAAVAGRRDSPGPLDAVLVGLLQGLAVLPGVSRSGTTVGALLLRGHGGPDALRLSFVLSIPAAGGAAAIAYAQHGLPAVGPGPAALALGTSAVVGVLTVDGLTRLVRRVAFSRVCLGFGALAVVGGALTLV